MLVAQRSVIHKPLPLNSVDAVMVVPHTVVPAETAPVVPTLVTLISAGNLALFNVPQVMLVAQRSVTHNPLPLNSVEAVMVVPHTVVPAETAPVVHTLVTLIALGSLPLSSVPDVMLVAQVSVIHKPLPLNSVVAEIVEPEIAPPDTQQEPDTQVTLMVAGRRALFMVPELTHSPAMQILTLHAPVTLP
jgi:hypothetical protein